MKLHLGSVKRNFINIGFCNITAYSPTCALSHLCITVKYTLFYQFSQLEMPEAAETAVREEVIDHNYSQDLDKVRYNLFCKIS